MVFRFDQFNVNTETFELSFNGEVRPVEPMVFDLIAHFAAHPDQVFTREELMASIWKGRIVSDATVATCVKNARKALGDTGNHQIFIQTVRGRGFKFTASVSRGESSIKSPAKDPDSKIVVNDLSINKKPVIETDPSILVLPFRCISNTATVEQLAGSLVVSLEAILTRIPLLRLSAQGHLYAGMEPQPTARQIYEDVGVDFVVDGLIQEVGHVDGNKLKATVQLANAKTGFRLWADSFDLGGSLTDAQNISVAAIVGKLEPQLHRAMYQSARSCSDQPTARQLFLKASGLLVMQGWHHESFNEAIPLLRQSVSLDAEFALAPALLSLLTGFGARIGLAADRKTATVETVESADQALKLDAMDSTVLGFAGCGLADVGYLDRGESLLCNAIDLNSVNAQALVALGTVRMGRHDLEDAIANLSKGIEISPLDSRLSVWGALLSIAHLMSGNIDAAVETASIACRRNDRTYLPRLALAGANFAINDKHLALRALEEARRIKPDLTRQQIAALIGRDLQKGLMTLE